MSKLIQLKLSKKKLKKYNKLVKLLGITGTFGEYQKAIDFSIDLTIAEIERQAGVLPNIKQEKLRLLIASIIRLREEKEKAASQPLTGQNP